MGEKTRREAAEKAARKEGCCGLCGKAWQPENYGTPRKCAFEGETFGANWSCGLVERIRTEMYDNADENRALRYRNDFGIGSVGALVIEVPSEDPQDFDDYSLSGLLVGTWYKDRGTTDSLDWAVACQGVEGGPLTREQAVRIVGWLEAREAARWAREEAAQAVPTGGYDFAAHLPRRRP